MQFVNIGYGNLVCADKILAVVSPEAAPIKRIVTTAKEKGLLIDASCGKKTQAVIVTVSDHVVLSALTVKQITSRLQGEENIADA